MRSPALASASHVPVGPVGPAAAAAAPHPAPPPVAAPPSSGSAPPDASPSPEPECGAGAGTPPAADAVPSPGPPSPHGDSDGPRHRHNRRRRRGGSGSAAASAGPTSPGVPLQPDASGAASPRGRADGGARTVTPGIGGTRVRRSKNLTDPRPQRFHSHSATRRGSNTDRKPPRPIRFNRSHAQASNSAQAWSPRAALRGYWPAFYSSLKDAVVRTIAHMRCMVSGCIAVVSALPC